VESGPWPQRRRTAEDLGCDGTDRVAALGDLIAELGERWEVLQLGGGRGSKRRSGGAQAVSAMRDAPALEQGRRLLC